ncbi:antibiotic biosynthesis monooxygenase [Endozoicomonas sp. OPT23]|nr:antibiotic biosynthesis monooxygenase [Endozoicomonas sp. OPT23]
MKKVILEGHIIVSNEDLPIILKELPVHIQNTKAENGCLIFMVQQQEHNPNKLTVYEEFIDMEAFELHQIRVKSSQWGRVTINVERHYHITEVA